MEGNAVPTSEGLEIRMVRNDRRNLRPQVAGAVAVQQVVQTMIQLGDKDEDTLSTLRVLQPPDHLKPLGNARELMRELIERRRDGARLEHRSHEEAAGFGIAEVRRFGDEGVVVGEKTGHRCDDAGAIRAGNGEDVALFLAHSRLPSPISTQATPTTPPRRSSPAPSSAPPRSAAPR